MHTRSVPLAPDVDLGSIAASTPGMVGADLANVANEAALLAARRGHSEVQRLDVSDALERIVLGAERKVMISDEDRRRTAYHESGHAIMGMLTPGADPVRKVSIIPRGQALGVTFSAPDADRFNFDERHLLAQIKVALGGRVAEEVVFGDLTTGAESDIQQLTRIARGMVGRWGMSPAIGPIAVLPSDGSSPLLPGVSETSEQTQRLIDEEVRRIVETAHQEATKELSSHRSNLDALVAELLAHETLDQHDAYAAAGLPVNRDAVPEDAAPVLPPAPLADDVDAPRAPVATSVAQARHPRQRLVALDDAQLDRVVVGAIVHQVPGAIGDLARVLRGGQLPQAVDQLQLEALDLGGGVAGLHSGERVARRLLPHSSRHQKSIAHLNLVHGGHILTAWELLLGR